MPIERDARETAEAVRDEIENARLSLANAVLSDGLDPVQHDFAKAVLGLLSISSKLAGIVVDLSARLDRQDGEARAPAPQRASLYPPPDWLTSNLEAA